MNLVRDRAARALATSLLLAALPLGAQPMASAGEPFGMLPLVDDVDPTSATDTHEHVEGPAGAGQRRRERGLQQGRRRRRRRR